ncbi:hypothetical protein [Aurantivibrio infirmus]
MYIIYQSVLLFHVIAGLFGLIFFWIPVLLRKGSPKHKKIGSWFVAAMTIAGSTGLIMAAMLFIDPIAARVTANDLSVEQLSTLAVASRERAYFFVLLGLLLLTSAQSSRLVLVAKADLSVLREPRHLVLPISLLIASAALLFLAITRENTLYYVFSGIGGFISLTSLRYRFKKILRPREWVIAHLGHAFGAGIAAHTAFFAFGANQVLSLYLQGTYALIPWLAPGIIGGIAITLTSLYYANKFGYYRSRSDKKLTVEP